LYNSMRQASLRATGKNFGRHQNRRHSASVVEIFRMDHQTRRSRLILPIPSRHDQVLSSSRRAHTQHSLALRHIFLRHDEGTVAGMVIIRTPVLACGVNCLATPMQFRPWARSTISRFNG